MVHTCQPPSQSSVGTVIKESGPKVIKFNSTELNPVQMEITHDTVHAIEVNLLSETSFQIMAAQVSSQNQQDLPIHFWFSDKPYGMTIPRNWQNLNIISLLHDPTTIYVSEVSVKKHPYDISLIVVPAGKYYVNLHNRHGRSSYYKIAIQVI